MTAESYRDGLVGGTYPKLPSLEQIADHLQRSLNGRDAMEELFRYAATAHADGALLTFTISGSCARVEYKIHRAMGSLEVRAKMEWDPRRRRMTVLEISVTP